MSAKLSAPGWYRAGFYLLIGLAFSYFWGARYDREHGIDHGRTREGAH